MLAAWEALKLFFSSGKNLLVVIFVLLVLGLAGFGLYKIYEAGATHGAAVQLKKDDKVFAADKRQIADLTAQLAKAKATIQDDVAKVQTWKDTAQKAQQDFQTLENTTVKDLQRKLAESNKRLTAAKQLAASLQENNPYVSQASDLQCVIPAGFVQLFNGSIEDPASTGIFGISVPSSAGLGYGAPSGISLSQLSSAVVIDLSAAVQRGDQVRAWQTWYTTTKANWDKVIQEIHRVEPQLKQPNPPVAANDPIAAPKRSGPTGG